MWASMTSFKYLFEVIIKSFDNKLKVIQANWICKLINQTKFV